MGTVGEEVGSTARQALTGLQATPNCLLALLLAAMFSILIYYSVDRERQQSHEHQMAVLERCFPLALMEGYQKLTGAPLPPQLRERSLEQ